MAAAAALAVTGCTGTEGETGSGSGGRIAYLNYGDFGGGSAPQQNYNPYAITTRLGATDYVFEQLMVIDNYSCEAQPWLATDYEWTDPKTLVYTLRDGVKFNDGKPFSATDVAYSFNMLKENSALDTDGVWRYLSTVEATDESTVTMTFKEPGASAFTLINNVKIVPEHVWSRVKDPVTFTNAKAPVGTGPFTVKRFNRQQLVIGRNPGYWQADKVQVNEIRFNKADGGGQVDQLKLSRGEYDTNSMFVPDIDKAFVDRDPKDNHYWYPPGGSISLYMNLMEKPFDDVAFRQALVHAFDKTALVEKAQLGYVEKASQTGVVVPGQEQWVSDDIPNKGIYELDAAKADQMLTEAGYEKDAQGRRLDKDGKPIKFTFKVPGSFTDWVAASKIVVKDLKALGFQVTHPVARPRVVRGGPSHR